MDPNATMKSILECLATLREGEDTDVRDELVEHLRNLADWLGRGGFAPQGQYFEKGD